MEILSASATWAFGREDFAEINLGVYGLCAVIAAVAVIRFWQGAAWRCEIFSFGKTLRISKKNQRRRKKLRGKARET